MFDLPYCTRCTEVLVAATHTVVKQASAIGLLKDRAPKDYICYMPEKRSDSVAYPKIEHAITSTHTQKAPYMARYIAHRIREIPPEHVRESRAKGHPTVLVIAPSPFADSISDYLSPRFPDVQGRKTPLPAGLSVVQAYRYLANDEACRLAWRILVDEYSPDGWIAALKDAILHDAGLADGLPETFVDLHLRLALKLANYESTPTSTEEDREAIAAEIGVDADAIPAVQVVPSGDADGEDLLEVPSIVITSLLGSKGLQAEHVFIAGVNADHFPSRSGPTDEHVCQLLVALTRARRTCTLVSTNRLGAQTLGKSVFVDWLRPHLNPLYVDKSYLESVGA
jgi:hypothetical protein